MLTVHHLGISQSDRIVWLCEELGLPYQLDKHDRDPSTGGGPAAYKALHPFGTAPVITDGDLVLGESGAIIEYIISRYGGERLAVAPSAPNYADYLYWFHFANGSLMPAMMFHFAAQRAGFGDADLVKRFGARRELAFEMIEARLGEAPYFAGDAFTAADIIMLFPLTMMRRFTPFDISGLPNLKAYLAKVVARPAYQRTLSVGDPDVTPYVD